MSDEKKQRGGARPGAGRKPKAQEEKTRSFALKAMKSEFGSESGAWDELAKLSRKSFTHMRMLFEYAYGKPKEDVKISGSIDKVIINETKTYDSDSKANDCP